MAQDPSSDLDKNVAAQNNRLASLNEALTQQDGEDEQLNIRFINKSNFLLHEYDSLRTEILQRGSTGFQIISLLLAAFAAVFVLQNAILPLAYPALALVLLNMYIVNAYNTRLATGYIKHYIETQVTEDGKNKVEDPSRLKTIGWQNYYDARHSPDFSQRGYAGGKAVFAVSSLIASVAGLLFNIGSTTKVWPGFIVVSFVITVLVVLVAFMREEFLVVDVLGGVRLPQIDYRKSTRP